MVTKMNLVKRGSEASEFIALLESFPERERTIRDEDLNGMLGRGKAQRVPRRQSLSELDGDLN